MQEIMWTAGNLQDEMEEMQKLISNCDESMEMARTFTAGCSDFLTLICC